MLGQKYSDNCKENYHGDLLLADIPFSINRLQSCLMKIYWELNNLDFLTNKLQSVFASKVFQLFSVVLNKMI